MYVYMYVGRYSAVPNSDSSHKCTSGSWFPMHQEGWCQQHVSCLQRVTFIQMCNKNLFYGLFY